MDREGKINYQLVMIRGDEALTFSSLSVTLM